MLTDLDFRGVDYSELGQCHLSLIRSIRGSCEGISVNSVLAQKTKALNRYFYSKDRDFQPFKFNEKFQITPGEFPQAAKANAVVNLFGSCDRACGEEHIAAIEWCTDNRLGIGTNLLKHAYLEKRFAAQEKLYLGIIIALDAQLISAAGMSSAVASTHEYRVHYDEIYSSVIRAPVALINLRYQSREL